jgi:hypothetical protein
MISWTEFEKLPGSAQYNFEILCRALIRLHYGRHGQFAALANQPGVEFHLLLHENCTLGARGEWFGWQCRWYDLPRGTALGATRRKQIEDALAKSAKFLPNLTDWILWTRYPLSKTDQNWFYALKASIRLHLWTSVDAETLLSGDAEILRKTYFGELLLTPSALTRQHELSVSHIQNRWLPEAHQTVDAERTLRRMLREAASWDDLAIIANRLISAIEVIHNDACAVAAPFSSLTPRFIAAARFLAETMHEAHRSLDKGDLEVLLQQLDSRPRLVNRDVDAVPRRLRAAKLACGLDATNALADMKLGVRLLDEVDSFLGTRMVGVLADAGGGKTQLAAQLTAEIPNRPAGILLYGRELHSGRTVDDLAKSIVIQGEPVPSMEALLAALDAAGQRARRRLPLVIDGLNEAEDPRDWKAPLASLDTLLQRFANVLFVCTLRTGARRPAEPHWRPQKTDTLPTRMTFAEQALPDGVERIEIPDFGGDTVEAIRKYFRYFRINPGEAELPELLSHPLTLRIFCEVTNPDRKLEVGIEAMPGSLTGLFQRYLDHAIERIGQLAPRNHRYYEQDIRRVLDVIGMELWEKGNRELPEQELRKAIGDDPRPWNESIIYMLEQEGVILRIAGEVPGRQNIILIYDALGGYLIANAILTNHGRAGLKPWLNESATLESLYGNVGSCHPLALDIFRALVGLLPRRLHRQQLWQLVDEPLRSVALRMAAALEGKYLDADTVTALAEFVHEAKPGLENLFQRLFRTRGALEHPLNAEFLDSVLRALPVSERDLRWTEWVRKNHDGIRKNLQQLEERWQRNAQVRTPSDKLRAKWIMWLLTTTAHNLRDRVTRALYWFGRGDPTALFDLAEGAGDINDPYVFERMLAASYGVAMAVHCDPRQPTFRKTVLPEHARRIFDLMFKKNAPARTTHVLTREYGRRFIELAALHNRKAFSDKKLARVRPPYSDDGRIVWQQVETGEEEVHGLDSPFRMDFENYTLGRLVRDRSNYDFKHGGYRKVRAQVLWRVQQLGWAAGKFQAIDRSIESESYRYSRTGYEHGKIDRYGKKYSWIAYFELGGWLGNRDLLGENEENGRALDIDIDPSFPSPTSEHQWIQADLLGDPKLSLSDWIKKGLPPDLTPYFRQRTILGELGPWVALDSFVAQQDESRGRSLFVFVRSFLVARNVGKEFAVSLAKQPLGGRWLPEKPECHFTFAGEVPWCETFPKSDPVNVRFVVKERKVKVKRKRPFFFLDGKPIKLAAMDLLSFENFASPTRLKEEYTRLTHDELERVERRDRIVDVEEVKQESRKLRAIIPVYAFSGVGRSVDDVSVNGVTLPKQLAQSAGLVHLPQTHDLQTKDGVRATYGTVFRPQDFNNCERFFFIRESILQTLLRKHGLSLVWAVWGERGLSYKHMEHARSAGDLPGLSYAYFQAVHRF